MKASVSLGAVSDWQNRTLSALRAVGRAQEQVISRNQRIGQSFANGARMAGGAMGVGGIAYGTQRLVRNGVNASAISARENARDYLAGLTPGESRQIGSAAIASSSRYPSVGASTMHESLRDTAMSMRSVEKAVELSDTIAQGMVVLQSLKGKDQAVEEARKFFKALDTLGHNTDAKQVRGLLDGYIKAMSVEGADLNLGGTLAMARQSRAAGGSLSDRFLVTTGPALQMDMGDHQVGTALASMLSQTIGGRATEKSKAEQKRFGLRDSKGKFRDEKMALENPDLYAWERLKPALEKQGVNTKDNSAVTAAISKLFSNRIVADIMAKLIQQEDQYRKKGGGDVGGYNRGPGLKAAGPLAQKDFFVALAGVKEQLGNLAAQVPGMDAASRGLSSLSLSIGAISKAFSEQSDFNKGGQVALAGITGITAGYLGLKGAKGAYQWFTGTAALAGSATALNGSAAALTAAAAKLGGGSLLNDIPGGKGPNKPSIGKRIGDVIATAAPAAIVGGAVTALAGAPLAIGAGGIYGATKAFPDDAESAGKRKSHAQIRRDAMLRHRREQDERWGLAGSMKIGPTGVGGSDVWSRGADAIKGLDHSAGAAEAARSTMEAYANEATAKLSAVDGLFTAAVARWNGILGGVNSSPTITPKFAPAPSVGKGASLGGASKQTAFADYGFNSVG